MDGSAVLYSPEYYLVELGGATCTLYVHFVNEKKSRQKAKMLKNESSP